MAQGVRLWEDRVAATYGLVPSVARLRDHSWAFPAYSALALTVAAVLALQAARVSNWSPAPRDLVFLAVLATGFVLARALAVEVDLRRDSLRITLTEVPLVIGIATLPGPIVIGSFALVVLAAGLCRRDAPAKLGLNLAVSLLSASVAVLLVGLGAELMPGVPTWVVVLLAVAFGHAAGTAVVMYGIALLPGVRNVTSTLRLIGNMYAVGVLSAIAGLACYQLATEVPWGGGLVALGTATLGATYWAYCRLLREQRDLELLNKVSLEVAGAGRAADEVSGRQTASDGLTRALELVRDQLNANRVVLHRHIHNGTGHEPTNDAAHALVAGPALPRAVSARETDTLLEWYAAGGVRRLDARESDRWGKRLCNARQAKQILVAPLQGADQVLGLIEVHDRQSHLRGFGSADLRLVETLASHLTTAVDNRRLLGQLRHDAYHDTLTELANHLGFREAAAGVLGGGPECAVVVIELDLLSSVNDALGHAWGQRVLQAAGDRLRATLPPGLVAGRLEGDRFAVLLVGLDDDEAVHQARALRDGLSAPYPVDRLEVECAAFVGVASTGVEPNRDIDILLQRADVALQEARTGDVPVRSYAHSMGQVFVRRFQLVTQFRQALELGQLDVVFQPELALVSGRITAAEALVRWDHPEFGPLDPEEFVSAVEATGLIEALTGFVLERALAQCAQLRAVGHDLSVAVNLSARNLADPAFSERVTEALARHDLPAGTLGFELTESAVMSDPERALPVLEALHALGVRLAVDDFGTGYSSLAYLRRLPVHEVKIDKSFVLGMGADQSDLAVVRAIVELGHSLGLSVTAEGVEEEQARAALLEMGCDTAQGYLISRPLAGERLGPWLADRAGQQADTCSVMVR